MKKIVVAGGSGFIGEPLVRRFVARSDDVAVLTRNPSSVHAGRAVAWNPPSEDAWVEEVAGADVVINLAGENVGGGRWTETRKKRVMESRVAATSALVSAMSQKPDKNRTLISASAIGFYGDRGDELIDESSAPGTGFLTDVTRRWEELARTADPFARVVILRFGIVLATNGGALAKLLLPFRLGAGGPMGNGRQWMSWIDREDVLRMIEWSVDHDSARGIYNVTAPPPSPTAASPASWVTSSTAHPSSPHPPSLSAWPWDRKWPTRCSSAGSASSRNAPPRKASNSHIPSWKEH